MTRIGKIARLPKDVREELNRRVQDGQLGSDLLEWLNELPKCKEVLAKEFDSQPISKQNLSQWKTGGYEEWLRKEESRQHVQMLVEKAEDLEEEAGGMAIADRLGTVLAAELATAMEQLKSVEDPKERWARLKDIARELYRLRREDHHGRRLEMAEAQWKIQSARDEDEYFERRRKEKAKEEIDMFMSIHRRRALAESLGGGEYGEQWADWIINMRHGLSMREWEKKYYPNEGKSTVQSPRSTVEERGQGKSESVRPETGEQSGGSKTEDGKARLIPNSKAQNQKLVAGQGKSRLVKVNQAKKGTKPTVNSPQAGNKSTVPSPQSTVQGERAAESAERKEDVLDVAEAANKSSVLSPQSTVEGENMGKDGTNGTDGTNEDGKAPRGGG